MVYKKKKDSFQQERQGEGALNKLISTIGFLEPGIESRDCRMTVRRGL